MLMKSTRKSPLVDFSLSLKPEDWVEMPGWAWEPVADLAGDGWEEGGRGEWPGGGWWDENQQHTLSH